MIRGASSVDQKEFHPTYYMPEVEGKLPGGELWALVFHQLPLPVNEVVKIIWRMTGSGDLHLVAIGPDGQCVMPTSLTHHIDSVWKRPGEEWGSLFTFPTPGNWNVHATRGSLSGEVWFLVQKSL